MGGAGIGVQEKLVQNKRIQRENMSTWSGEDSQKRSMTPTVMFFFVGRGK